MKMSLTATAIIVALFALLGIRTQMHLESAREKHDRSVAEAKDLGFAMPLDGGDLPSAPGSEVARAGSQRARDLRVREAARRLAIFGNDRDAIGAMGPDGDQDRQLDFEEGLAEATELDAGGLKLLVAEILANDELSTEMRGNLVSMVAYYMSEKNPAGALALLMDSRGKVELPADQFSNMLGAALEKLGHRDPERALEWMRRNEREHPGLLDQGNRAGAIGGIAMSDPALAFSALREFDLAQNPIVMEGIGLSAGNATERSAVLASLRAYAASIGSEEDRQIAVNGAMKGMGSCLVRGSFESASRWLEAAKLDQEEAAGLAGGIDASLAKGDTGKWIDWMARSQVPVDQLRSKADELMKFWAQEDYRAAGTWLESVTDGPTRDAAVKAYAGAVAPTDPGVAAQWALTLPEGAERTELIRNIHAEWKKQDETAAGRFARDSGIGE